MAEDRSAFLNWDAEHYLFLAKHGYTEAIASTHNPAYIAFLPLYPKTVGLLGGSLAAALLVSWSAAALFFWGLWRLSAREGGPSAAWAAVGAAVCFPTAYFLWVPYTESMFMALTVWAWVWAPRNLGGSALLAGLASATRLPGILVFPSIVVARLAAVARKPRPYRWRENRFGRLGLCVAMGATGFGAYLILNQVAAGSPFAFLAVQSQRWGRALTWPWSGGVAALLSYRWRAPEDYLYVGAAECVAGIFLWGCSFVAIWRAYRKKLSTDLALFTLGVTVMATCSSFWLSNPRLVLSAPSIFVLMGQGIDRLWRHNRIWRLAVIALGGVSVALQVHFAQRFFSGAWAF